MLTTKKWRSSTFPTIDACTSLYVQVDNLVAGAIR